MTNDKTVTMSREFKAGFTDPVGDCGKFEASIDVDSWGARIAVYGDTAEDAEQLRAEVMAKLAAPVVERQEPVDAILLEDCVEHFMRDYGKGYFSTPDCIKKLYTSPPAPVSVVLPVKMGERSDFPAAYRRYAKGWNECLDKVKELNQ